LSKSSTEADKTGAAVSRKRGAAMLGSAVVRIMHKTPTVVMVIVVSLAAVCIATVVAVAHLEVQGHTAPSALVAVAGVCAGALATALPSILSSNGGSKCQ